MNMFKKIVSFSLLAAFAAGMTPLAAGKGKKKAAPKKAASPKTVAGKKPQGIAKPAEAPKRAQKPKGPLADLIREQLEQLAAAATTASDAEAVAAAITQEAVNRLLAQLQTKGLVLADVRDDVAQFLTVTNAVAAAHDEKTILYQLRKDLQAMFRDGRHPILVTTVVVGIGVVAAIYFNPALAATAGKWLCTKAVDFGSWAGRSALRAGCRVAPDVCGEFVSPAACAAVAEVAKKAAAEAAQKAAAEVAKQAAAGAATKAAPGLLARATAWALGY